MTRSSHLRRLATLAIAIPFAVALTGFAAPLPATPTSGCVMGACDGGKGDCLREPLLTCDGITGYKCVFAAEE